jgi:tRNA(Ile)-lysidine synthase
MRGLQPLGRWQSSSLYLTVIRPLLEISRSETAAYCKQHGLRPKLDASNLSLSPLRNKIRLELLPLLQKYNPQAIDALLRTARIATDELSFFNQEIERLRGEVSQKQNNAIALDKEKFQEWHPALKRHLLRSSIEELAGNLKDIEARHIEELLEALGKPAGKRITLPEGLVFSVEYDKYLLSSDPAASSPFPVLEAEYALNVPGETLLPGWRITATIINREQMTGENSNFTAHFDLDKVGDNLSLRRRKVGDRFQPLGMSHPKKLNEFMIDAKIPRSWRQRIPIVCSPRQILWVAGLRIDERAKITDVSQRVLMLKMERATGG